MLRMLGNPRRFCDGVTRRETLIAGALSTMGGMLNLPNVLALEERRAADGPRPRAKSVLLLYLHGGAPTQDMFDLKPHAPAEIRGEFHPIATNVTGIQICEHLPKTAQWMHRCAIVRSVYHRAGCHNTLPGFTGSEQPVDVNEPIPRDSFRRGWAPSASTSSRRMSRCLTTSRCPIILAGGGRSSGRGRGRLPGQTLRSRVQFVPAGAGPSAAPGRGPMWLGTPFLADADLSQEMTIDRLSTRRTLLQQIDDHERRFETQPAADTFDRVRRRAFSLLTGSKLKTAFALEREDPRLRRSLRQPRGRSSTLIARRLIEAGVRFVEVYWDGYTYRVPNNNLDPYWDTHSNNFIQMRRVNLPNLDQTFDALLGDLEQRGLLEETLVVMMSDFGRTPRVNATAGRDHWTDCYSVVLAGAGIRGGTICGASDAHAAYVREPASAARRTFAPPSTTAWASTGHDRARPHRPPRTHRARRRADTGDFGVAALPESWEPRKMGE